MKIITNCKAAPWLRQLVAGLSPRNPMLAPGSIHVGFVVDKVALGQVFLRVLRFSLLNIIHSTVAFQLISSRG
jgi:small ligand-binding sensory domain FIST